MVFVWLRDVVDRQLTTSSHGRKERRPRRRFGFKPGVEALEERALLTAGILDPTFGTGGLVNTNFSYTDTNSLAVQPNGQIVVAGVSDTTGVFSVARFNPDGSLDASFGNNGVVDSPSFAPGSTDRAIALALQPDGRIVVGGDTTAGGSQSNFGLERLNADGSLDTSFGNDGHVIIDFSGGNDLLSGIAIDSLGRIVAAGLSDTHFAVARVLSDGTQDSDFDGNGEITFDFAATITGGKVTGSTDGINAIAIQPNGAIVVAGFTNLLPNLQALGNTNNFALARFNALDGTLDSSFGSGGLVDMNFLGADTNNTAFDAGDTANSLTFLSSGDIAVAGVTHFGGGGQNFGLAMFTSGGQLDRTFNVDGLVETDFSTNFTSGNLGHPDVQDVAYSVAVQPDGKLLLAGFSTRNGNSNFALTRYNTDGTLDQNFGIHGEVVTAFTLTSHDQAANLVLQPNGQILAAGTSDQGSGPKFAMARYSAIQAGDLEFSSPSYTIAKNGGVATIIVTRTGGSDGTVTVNYTTSDATAKAGTDYTATSGTLSFAPGQTSQSFTVPILDNGIFNPTNKAFNIALSSPTGGGTLGIPNVGVVTITNTDTPSDLQFSASAYSIAENGGSVTITVTRTGPNDNTVTVNYSTSDGTAVAGTNYTPTSGTLTFTPGQLSQTFAVPVRDDGVFQLTDLTLNVNLSSPSSNAVIGSPPTAVVTLLEADGTPNQLFVVHAYRDLLNRTVDPTGLANWVAALNAGATRAQVALAIESSQEYRSLVVENLYTQYLHRAADAGGLATFTAMLAAGGTDEQVAAAIVGSAEFYQNQGGGTNAGFLNALYEDALGRTVDSSGLNTFVPLLNTGTSTQQVATQIFASNEYAQDLVLGWYQRFLHRAGDPTGVAYFVSLMHPTSAPTQPVFITDPTGQNQPLSDEQVIAMIVGSQEYLSNLT